MWMNTDFNCHRSNAIFFPPKAICSLVFTVIALFNYTCIGSFQLLLQDAPSVFSCVTCPQMFKNVLHLYNWQWYLLLFASRTFSTKSVTSIVSRLTKLMLYPICKLPISINWKGKWRIHDEDLAATFRQAQQCIAASKSCWLPSRFPNDSFRVIAVDSSANIPRGDWAPSSWLKSA